MTSRKKVRSRSDSIMRSAEIAHSACTEEHKSKRQRNLHEDGANHERFQKRIQETHQKADDHRATMKIYSAAQAKAIKDWAAAPKSSKDQNILSHCLPEIDKITCACCECPSLWRMCDESFKVPPMLLLQMEALQDRGIHMVRSFDCIPRHGRNFGLHHALQAKVSQVRKFLLIWSSASNCCQNNYSSVFVHDDSPSNFFCILLSMTHDMDWDARNLIKKIARAYVHERVLLDRRMRRLSLPLVEIINRFIG